MKDSTGDKKTDDLVDCILAFRRGITVPELSRLLCVSSRLIYRMVADGELPAMRICNCIRFNPAAVVEWLRNKSSAAVSRKRASNPTKPVAAIQVKNLVKRTYIKVS